MTTCRQYKLPTSPGRNIDKVREEGAGSEAVGQGRQVKEVMHSCTVSWYREKVVQNLKYCCVDILT